MKRAILFAGQGSQKAAMGLDFYEKDIKAKVFIDALSMKDEILETFSMDDERLRKTRHTQIALIAFETMISHLLEEIEFSAAAGLSIGEYAALHKARVLTAEETLKIAEYRGKMMQQLSEPLETSMVALMTEDVTLVEDKMADVREPGDVLEISNLNTRGQIVVSGDKEAVLNLRKILKSLGVRSVPLKVGGPFHTSYMAPVELGLNKFFDAIDFKIPQNTLYLNLTGKAYEGEDLKAVMAKQVSHAVRFQEIIENMILQGIDTFVEIGYGQVLSKFVKKIKPDAKTYAIATYDDYLNLRGEI